MIQMLKKDFKNCSKWPTNPYYSMSEEYITKMNRICAVHSFTKHSRNTCLIDTHIFTYRYTRCDCKWIAPWFYYVFWVFFFLSCRAFMSEVLYLHQITFTDYVSEDYGRFSYSIAFFGIFSYITTCLIWYNFIKFLRTVC